MTTVRPLPLALLFSLLGLAIGPVLAQPSRLDFTVEEATIAQVHNAMRAGTLTCRRLVDHYLSRIDAYDRRGPSLGAIVARNADAPRDAERLDAAFAAGGFVGPLHCVPIVVKDNIETIGLPTTAGSLALKDFSPGRDATVVARLKAAGVVILGKTNMAEFALNPLATDNSAHGRTRNPYSTDRVTAGSSGGTAVAVTANLSLAGIGTDTGSSVRGPAAHTAIVGIRPTLGLVSRAGMIPLNTLTDTIGPMARTIEDAVALLEVMAGWDPADPATERLRDVPPPRLSDALEAGGLKGVRLGILRQAYQGGDLRIDDEIARVFARAIRDLGSLGAEVVDPVLVERVELNPIAVNCRGLKYDLNAYLARQGTLVKVRSLAEIISSGQYHASIERDLLDAQASVSEGPGSAACQADERYRKAFGAAIYAAMDRQRVDALIYPTWSQPPQLAVRIAVGSAGQTLPFASTAGLPALTVPMGTTHEVLPAGLSFLGRAWGEARLLHIAYQYEQATRHRHPPVLAAPIR